MTSLPPEQRRAAKDLPGRPVSGPGGLLEPGLGDASVTGLVAEVAYVAEVLAFERALARACSAEGVIPEAAAEAIVAAAKLSSVGLDTLGSRVALSGSPVVPIIEDLCAAAGPAGSAWVHFGATSQDAWDTATVVLAKRVVEAARASLAVAAERAAELARREARTLMIGRTLGQHAAPYSFGLKAAGWCLALEEAGCALRAASDRLAVQLGGATGSLAGFKGRGGEVRRRIARELGLVDPKLPWHTNRTSIGQLAGSLGVAAGVWSKIGLDVVLLAQTEVGEVAEGGASRGRSSAMPHKRNPSRAVEVRAGGLRVPGLVATVLSAMAQENERGAGTWQAEWAPLRELLQTVGGMAVVGEALLASLEIDRERMRSNFEVLRGLPMSESLANMLAPHVGRLEAQAIVRELASEVRDRGVSLLEAAAADERVRSSCSNDELSALLDVDVAPEECARLVEEVLEAREAQRARSAASGTGPV